MLANFLSSLSRRAEGETSKRRLSSLIVLPLWICAGFIISELLVSGIVKLLTGLGAPLGNIDATVLMAIFAACVYVLSLVLVIGVPWLSRHSRTTKEELGLSRLPNWSDMWLAPAGFIIYILLSGLLAYLVAKTVPGFNASQQQQVGFSNLVHQYEMILAFITLVIIAPVAEETLFRGYLYGKLRRAVPLWAAMLVTSAVFAVLHGQWNVGLDVFVLSLVMCSLREITGSIWAGVLVHMIKNGLAFYFLFINPILMHTIGG